MITGVLARHLLSRASDSQQLVGSARALVTRLIVGAAAVPALLVYGRGIPTNCSLSQVILSWPALRAGPLVVACRKG